MTLSFDFEPFPPERYVITGGRHFGDAVLVALALSCILNDLDIVIQGGATGADALAKRWALANGHPVETYHADWKLHGPAAGPIRNRLMLTKSAPRAVIAFPGGRGTANCVAIAREMNIHVIEVDASFQPAWFE